MDVSPEGTSLSDAIRLLAAAAADALGNADFTLLLASLAVQKSLEEDLARSHTLEQEERHEELTALLENPYEQPLARDTWALVLANLGPEEQHSLQTVYEDLARGAEVSIEYGNQADAETAEELMHTLYPVEALLAELPHTNLERSLGPDDHDLRRRALSVDVSWSQPDSDAPPGYGTVDVIWRDGYQTTVATMTVAIHDDHGAWVLEISDPAPGRTAHLVVDIRPSESAPDTARRTIEQALAWAQLQLGDDYVLQPSPDTHQ
jgi:hypothetical protein